ncbi:OmpA family protein [Aquimarina sp. W85]|uniref:OmpA family protein n=1 Tax=Aquimarina rhodophyticola TaxID=3342246 RepID=UPI00366ECBDB
MITPKMISFNKSIFSLLLLVLCSNFTTSYAQVEVPLSKRTEFTLKGDFQFVSNTILGKVNHDDGSQPFDPNMDYNEGGLNNQFQMGFIDIDKDPTTFNSSSADLILPNPCATIKHVGLYWTAAYADKHRDKDITSIKIKYPNSNTYTTIDNATIIHDYYSNPQSEFKQYSCYKDITADVTSLINPQGTYTVANIPASTTASNNDEDVGNGLAGGWTMIFIYEDATVSRKRFYVYDGFVNIDTKAKPVEFAFKNFQTIPKGAVHGKLGIIAFEGDKGIKGDRFQMYSNESKSFKGITDGSNPMNNFFNANITENGKNVKTRKPASSNTLGYDADVFNIKNVRNNFIGNNQTEATFKLLTESDGYSVTAVAFSVEIYEPAIHMIKQSRYADNSLVHPNDNILPDQEIAYSLTIFNEGNDDSKHTIIKDQLPYNVTLIENSLKLPKKIKKHFDPKTNCLEFKINDKLVTMDSEPFTIHYKIKTNASCNSILEIDDLFIKDLPVTATFTGTLNENIKFSQGYNYINQCKLPDFYSFKLALDITDLNCQNIQDLIAMASQNTSKSNAFLPMDSTDDKGSEQSQATGLNPTDLTPKTSDPVAAEQSTTKTLRTLRDLIQLDEIYFEFDRWNITERAAKELNKIVDLMINTYPEMIIKVETHSDSRGDDTYNLILSKKRAESIYTYLISQNIAKDRILSHTGFGESKPLNNCKDGQNCSEDEYKINRRSNFIIVSSSNKTVTEPSQSRR